MRTANLALVGVILMLAATACIGQGWKEIRTPPTRRDPTIMFGRLEQLEPLAGPEGWAVAAHDQSAEADLFEADGREPGTTALGVRYRFAGQEGLRYVEVAKPVPLPDDLEALGLWVRGGEHPLPCRLRIVDSSGETHQFDLGQCANGEWRLCVTATDAGSHWGGDGNGVLDPPFRLQSILFDKLTDRFVADGELTIAELATFHKLPDRLYPHGISVFIPQNRATLVYEPGEAIQLAVAAEDGGRVRATVVDPFGAIVAEELVGGAEEPQPLSVDIDVPGAYDMQLRLEGQEDAPDAPWADFRFAVMPPPRLITSDSPFGVCTHFGQAWPLPVMDLIARAGIGIYRDEMSWGALEREKDVVQVPERYAEYAQRGSELGLSLLLIVDYANQHYDGGGYPVSPEARAGFARYAATVAGALRDHIPTIEVWNEWCGGCGMPGLRGNADEYPALYLDTAAAIRQVHPDAVLIGVGGEYGDVTSDNVATMMGQGAGEQMDGFSIHPYHYPRLADGWLREHLTASLREAEAAAGKPVPLWITEIGWPTQMDARGSSFLHQARCLVRMVVIALTTPGVERVVWYDFKDDGQSLTYNEHNFGLVHHEEFLLAPKPAYVAYANLIASATGRQLVEHEITADRLWRTVYEGEDGRVTILFADGESQSIQVGLSPGARVTDMFGTPVRADGTLTVTRDPVFVYEG